MLEVIGYGGGNGTVMGMGMGMRVEGGMVGGIYGDRVMGKEWRARLSAAVEDEMSAREGMDILLLC